MTKIDKRHIYGICIDTETCNNLDNPLFYDVGWQVIDSYGRLYKSRSFINTDVYYQYKDLMQSAYYSNKLPAYENDLFKGKRLAYNMYQIRQALLEDVKEYNCKFIIAHNARFDYRALNGTQRYVTKSKYRFFTPYGLEWWDTMKMADSVICKMPTYIKFCQENGYLTQNGKPRKTAEILYRFISKNNSFIESHTGLEDVNIERQILAYCKKQHKKMQKTLF